MSATTTVEVRLARHVDGELTEDVFEIAKISMASPTDGEVAVRTDYVPVAAAFKEMMRQSSRLPVPPWGIGQRISTPNIGTVVESRSPDLSEGDLVMSMTGWCGHTTGHAGQYFKLDRNLFPDPAYYLNQGLTPYYGLTQMAHVGEGDTVFVSGAAGGVGSMAGQIAKCLGAQRVIGSAGSQEKVAYLTDELGFDAAFDYREGPVLESLRRLAPDGIDVFFDTVGGEHFEAAVEAAAPGARFALCGSLSSQLGDGDGRPRFDLMAAIGKGLVLRPFVTDYSGERVAEWSQHFGQWLVEGRLKFAHTIVRGPLSAAPHTFVELERGAFTGTVSHAIEPA